MQEHTGYLPGLSPVAGKQIDAAFDGGMLSSDAGLLLLREVERRLGIADRLAACLPDRRDPARIEHTIAEMIGFRTMAIAAGYEDGDDCDSLRCEPVFKMAVGRLPESGAALCSQPTMSRLENAVSRVALLRMMAAMVDLFCDSWARVPQRIELDIDDTEDAVHGCQQLALFNAYYDSHCFLPIHIYEATSGKPVAAILRPGKTPSGTEVRTVLKHVIRRIRRNWPRVEILVRGDSHYGRPEALDWCEDNGIDYVFGLSVNPVLTAMVAPLAEDVGVRRATNRCADAKVRRYGELIYAAKSWRQERRRRSRRGLGPGLRQPLRRHQSRDQAQGALRARLLCARTDGEPDQGAQDPSRLRSHLLPRCQGQPVPPHPPLRRLLADARLARRRAQALQLARRPVRHLAHSPH